MLDLKQSTFGAYPVLSPIGRIDNMTAQTFEETLLKMLEKYSFTLIIDLTDLEYMNSTGLRALLVAARKARQVHKRLIFCQLRKNIREIFDMSGLSEWCTVYQNIAEAASAKVH